MGEWLMDLPGHDCRALGLDRMRAQWCWPVGMVCCPAQGEGLWEIRTNLPSGRIPLFWVCDHDTLVAFPTFIYNTQKTPPDELTPARKRMKDLKS